MSETQEESEAAQTSPTRLHEGGDWLTVSQAAAALGVSERTARRMCESGRLAATVENGESGGRVWHVDREAITQQKEGQGAERAATLEDDRAAKISSVRPKRAATNKTSVRPPFKRESERAAISRNIVRPTLSESVRPTEKPTENALLIAEKDARIAELREQLDAANEREKRASLQIEAAHRQAAEATAALREYLKLQAKALPENTSSTRNAMASATSEAAPKGVEATKDDAMGNQAVSVSNAAQKTARREMRPLWKVILGIR